MSHTNDTLGPVDIIVNCAGLGIYTTMKNCHFDEWEKMVDVNCKVKKSDLGLYSSFWNYASNFYS